MARQKIIPSISDSPSDPGSSAARKHLTKQEFGRRLYRAILEKGWTQSELARQAGILRDSVSTYIRGRNMPDAVNLKKIAKALGMKEADLLPNYDEAAIEAQINPPFEVRASAEDPTRMWVKLNRELPLATVTKLMQLLEGEDAPAQARKGN